MKTSIASGVLPVGGVSAQEATQRKGSPFTPVVLPTVFLLVARTHVCLISARPDGPVQWRQVKYNIEVLQSCVEASQAVNNGGTATWTLESVAKFLYCVRTACARQRLGYSPKNTCHQSRGWGFLEDPLAPRHKANAQMQCRNVGCELSWSALPCW